MSPPKSQFCLLVRAPSNIALVKYMGKVDAVKNIPANPSLSMTLSKLCTYVEVVARAEGVSETILREGKPTGASGESPVLDAAGSKKFIAHFERCRDRAPALLGRAGLEFCSRPGAELRSTNTFPQAAGIASSASSFAALTLGAIAYFAADPVAFRAKMSAATSESTELLRDLAALSREGSGSSCRSFGGPFVAWEGENVSIAESALAPLSDLVVVVSGGKKEVGSSEAHRRVTTSSHWAGRVARAEERYRALRSAILGGDFASLAELAAADTEDMHRLFETASPAFTYRTPATLEVVAFLSQVGSPFAATLDAGPNVHVIVPQSTEDFWRRRLVERFPQYPVLVDRQGNGAEIVSIEGSSDGSPEGTPERSST